MKNTFALITILSALTLTACGGGGSDSPVAVNQPTNSGNPVVNPNQQLVYDYLIYENGTEISVANGWANADPYPQNRLNIMNIDGRNIEIVPAGVSGAVLELEDKSKGIRKTVGGNLSYGRYGIISYDKENKDYEFFQGIPSISIPKAGTATYKGYAVAIRPYDRVISKGTSSFNVDFGKKTLSGEIKTEKFGNFKFDTGEIKQYNDFSFRNTDVNKPDIGGIGEFVGDNAAEMVGSFSHLDHNNPKNNISGTFGAKKQ